MFSQNLSPYLEPFGFLLSHSVLISIPIALFWKRWSLRLHLRVSMVSHGDPILAWKEINSAVVQNFLYINTFGLDNRVASEIHLHNLFRKVILLFFIGFFLDFGDLIVMILCTLSEIPILVKVCLPSLLRNPFLSLMDLASSKVV